MTAKKQRKVTMRTKSTKDFVERLKEIRGDRSQREFGKEIGVFQQNIGRYESGQIPHLHFVMVLYEKEGIDPTWLITGTGSMKTRKAKSKK